MSEVGALLIRLQADTARFREDMGKVKADLDDLKGGAKELGQGITYSMLDARGSLMIVEESVGVHLPRALNTLIARIPGVGSAFAAMLPVVGVLAAIGIVGELISKVQEMREKVRESGDAFAKSFNDDSSALRGLQEKLLEAGIKVDELTKNHLDALHKELQLIDDQSLDDLMQTFGKFAGVADTVFAQLKTSWYQFGSGSEGAKNALTEFGIQYNKLLLAGDKAGASSLLAGTLRDAKEAQAALQALQHGAPSSDTNAAAMFGVADAQQKVAEWQRQVNILRKDGLMPLIATQEAVRKELMSQDEFVNALQSQAQAQKTIEQITSANKQGAVLGEQKRVQEESNKAMEQQLALQRVILTGVDAHIAAVHKLAQTNAEAALAALKTPEQSIQSDANNKLAEIGLERNAAIQAANDELDAKKRAYDAEIKAASSNKAKLKELDAQYRNDVQANADAILQANAEANAKSVAVTTDAKNTEKRAAIAATQERYDGELKAAVEAAQNQQKLAVETAKNLEALGKLTTAQVIQAEVAANARLAAVEKAAYDKRISLLDQYAQDYTRIVAKLNSQVLADTTKGDQQVQAEKQAAMQKQAMTVQSAENRMADAIATDVARSIVMNKSLAQSFRQTGEEMAEGMIKNLIMMELTANKTKLIDAKVAFGNAYKWASAWGGPPAGAVAGAAAFASVMSFEIGGKIPGQTNSPVPIIGHEGETVVTKSLTDRVERAEAWGGNKGGGDTHVHFAPQIHAVDATGVDAMLTKHASVFHRHINAAFRKMNRG